MLRNVGLRKSVEQPVLDLNFAAAQIGSNGAPDSRIDFSRGTNAWFVDSDGLVKKSPHNLHTYSEQFDNAYWIKGAGSVTANAIAAPDGTLTADLFTEDTANTTHNLGVNLGFNYVSGTTYASSVYVKANGRTKLQLNWRSNWFPPGVNVDFDLTAETATLGSAAVLGEIENVGNGWFRLTAMATADATGSSASDLYINFQNDSGDNSYTGDGSSGMYVWGAQLSQHYVLPVGNPYVKTEGSAVYAARLDHDPTWFMSAAQEQNLLRYSEMLDQSGGGLNWGLQKVDVTANAGTDPLGGSTAELVLENSNSGSHNCKSPDFDVTAGKVYTVSCYVKLHAGSRTFRLAFSSGAGGFTFAYAQFALTNETCVLNAADTTNKIEDVGNGWFRVSIQSGAATESVKTGQVNFQLVSSGSTSYQGDGTSGFLIWGTQVEIGSTVGTYHRTEGAPYYGEGATPKGLLIEEQRANLIPNSNALIDNDGLSGNVSNTPDAALGPDGTVTAVKLAANSTTTSNPRVFYPASGITLSAADYTFSIFLKKAEVNWVKVRIGVSGNFPGVFFNLDNGTVGTASTGFTGKIVEYGNGWYRCSVTAAASIMSASTFFTGVHLATADNTLLSSATVGDGVFMWGYSLELGSFPTSYIETTGSSATRNADVATMGPTVAPDKLGPELVTNGTFDTATDWGLPGGGSGTVSITGGVLDYSSVPQFNSTRQNIASKLTVGKRYRMSMDVVSYTAGSVDMRYQVDGAIVENIGNKSATGTYTLDFTCTDTSVENNVNIQSRTNGANTFQIDNISVKEILPV